MRRLRLRPPNRGISPVVGVVLLVAITLLLASVVGVVVLGVDSERPSPNAAVQLTADAGSDRVRVSHLSGADLSADHTRIVWEVGDDRFITDPADAERLFRAGQSVTATFDGATTATGQWWAFPSPAAHDIEPGEEVTVTLYDTRSEKPVVRQSVTAGTGTLGTVGSGLIWPADDTAGVTGVQYGIDFTIQSGSPTVGNSLNSIEIDVTTGTPDLFSGTGTGDVALVGVDTDGDGAVEQTIESDVNAWTVSDGGSTLKIGFGGSAYTNPQAGETIVLRVDGVDNPPSAGSYGVQIQTSGDGNWQSGSVDVD